eukprot:g48718.t1
MDAYHIVLLVVWCAVLPDVLWLPNVFVTCKVIVSQGGRRLFPFPPNLQDRWWAHIGLCCVPCAHGHGGWSTACCLACTNARTVTTARSRPPTTKPCRNCRRNRRRLPILGPNCFMGTSWIRPFEDLTTLVWRINPLVKLGWAEWEDEEIEWKSCSEIGAGMDEAEAIEALFKDGVDELDLMRKCLICQTFTQLPHCPDCSVRTIYHHRPQDPLCRAEDDEAMWY